MDLFQRSVHWIENEIYIQNVVFCIGISIIFVYYTWASSKSFSPRNCSVCVEDDAVVVGKDVMRIRVNLLNSSRRPVDAERQLTGSETCTLKLYKDEAPNKFVKEISLNITAVYENHFYIEWVPTTAFIYGEVFYGNDQFGVGYLKMKATPGPLAKIQTNTKNDAQNQFIWYKGQNRNVSFKGLDQFGNTVTEINTDHWYLEAQDENEVRVKTINPSLTSPLSFSFSFSKEGTYHVRLKSRDEQNNVFLPATIIVNVIPAPIDPGKCHVRCTNTEELLFAPCSVTVMIEVTLNDVMSKPLKKCSQSDMKLLTISFVKNNCNVNQLYKYDYSNKVCSTLKVDVERDCTGVRLQCYYKGKKIGRDIIIDVAHVVPYRHDQCLIKFRNDVYRIYKFSRSKLLGEDGANVDNINRVLGTPRISSTNQLAFANFQSQNREGNWSVVDIDVSLFRRDDVRDVIFHLLSMLTMGLHYRSEAAKFNEHRERWKTEAQNEHQNSNFESSSKCKDIKENFSKLMDKAHLQASQAIFNFFNYGRDSKEIDLHGQLVADEGKLRDYRKQLLESGKSKVIASQIIDEKRWHMECDEAIRYLTAHNVTHKRVDRDWLEIIVGAGHHSQDNRQKIRPKVEKFLRDKSVEFKECNKGSLLITYREYRGREPCPGSFYCKKCGKSWTSNHCWNHY